MSLAAGLLDCGILRGRISCLPLMPGKSQKGVAVGGDYRKPEGQQLRPLIPLFLWQYPLSPRPTLAERSELVHCSVASSPKRRALSSWAVRWGTRLGGLVSVAVGVRLWGSHCSWGEP